MKTASLTKLTFSNNSSQIAKNGTSWMKFEIPKDWKKKKFLWKIPWVISYPNKKIEKLLNYRFSKSGDYIG